MGQLSLKSLKLKKRSDRLNTNTCKNHKLIYKALPLVQSIASYEWYMCRILLKRIENILSNQNNFNFR
jgi:hypothetical protein